MTMAIIDPMQFYQALCGALAIGLLLIAMSRYTAEKDAHDLEAFASDVEHDKLQSKLNGMELEADSLRVDCKSAQSAVAVTHRVSRADTLRQKALIEGWVEVSGCSSPVMLEKKLNAFRKQVGLRPSEETDACMES